MPSKKFQLIAIDDVRNLIREHLGLKNVSRPSVYTYMHSRGLPKPLAFGVPKMWRKEEIMIWIQSQIKGS